MRVNANMKLRASLALALASAGLALVSSPASAAAQVIDLCAVQPTTDWTVVGSVTVPIWGFGVPATPGDCTTATTPSLPGPILPVNEADTVTMNVTNALPTVSATGDTTSGSSSITALSSTADLAAGMTVAGTGVPTGVTIVSVDSSTDTITISDEAIADGTGVALTFGHRITFEIPGVHFDPGGTDADPGQTVTRTFTATDPGTYLYQSSGDAGRQLAMGLYGLFIVRPTTAGQAYDDPNTAYNVEAPLVLSQVDPAFNAAPNTFNMLNYKATYWLINGLAYPDTEPIEATSGQKVLLRYVNAGYDNSAMSLLGVHEHVIARDAHLLGNPFDAATETIPAGATEDAIVTVPCTSPTTPSGFALFNRNLHVTNGSGVSYDTPGGMLTFIAPTGSCPP